jgi:hypothetical protein
MKTIIFNNYAEFLTRSDIDVNGVSPEFAVQHPDYEKQNETNKSCWSCSDCYLCSDCSNCSDCYLCSDCSNCSLCSECSNCTDGRCLKEV